MTPAERLRAAADTIERTANAVNDRVVEDWRILHVAAIDDVATAMHVALWDPPTALLAATLLRDMADRVTVRTPLTTGPRAAAFALADAILAGAEVQSW